MKSPFRIGVGRFINAPAMYKRGVAPDQSCDCGAGVRTKYHIRACGFLSGDQQIYVNVVK